MDIKVLASGSSGNCYRISDGSTSILLECGIKYKEIERLLDYNVDVSACLISHSHKDHSLSAKDLIKLGIDIYTSEETAKEIDLSGYGVHFLESNKQYTIGTFLVVPFDLVHYHNNGEVCKNFGYLIYSTVTKDKLLFATDTAYIHNRFVGLNYIMIETNYCEELLDIYNIAVVEKRRYISHQSLETAIKFLKANDLSKVKQIYAIHLSSNKANKKIVKEKLQMATGKEVIVY